MSLPERVDAYLKSDPKRQVGWLFLKTSVVTITLLILWAVQGKDATVVYMRF